MASLLSSNPTLASVPTYSFSQTSHNAAAGYKQHGFYPLGYSLPWWSNRADKPQLYRQWRLHLRHHRKWLCHHCRRHSINLRLQYQYTLLPQGIQNRWRWRDRRRCAHRALCRRFCSRRHSAQGTSQCNRQDVQISTRQENVSKGMRTETSHDSLRQTLLPILRDSNLRGVGRGGQGRVVQLRSGGFIRAGTVQGRRSRSELDHAVSGQSGQFQEPVRAWDWRRP